MTLHKTIQKIVQANPNLSTAEVFELVRPQFPDDDPVWLKAYIKNIRCKVRKKTEHENHRHS